jgi:argininosuccinate synthase
MQIKGVFMKVTVAYSGGLDTSAALVWLKKVKKAAQVDAVLVDVGQKEDLKFLSQRALQLGADSVTIVDSKASLCEKGIGPLLRATARYENQYLLGTAIARPFIAEALMKVASEKNADSVCHGATGKGNDYLRFEQRILSINPDIKIISPWREWQLGGREEAFEYLKNSDVSFSKASNSPFNYSQDANIWHTSYEGGSLENLELPVPSELQSRMLQEGGAQVKLDWVNGLPVRLNDEQLPLHQLIENLNSLLFKTGYGWIDLVETRTNGIKSRGIYYTPAGTLLYAAQFALMSCYFSGPTLKWIQDNSPIYSQLIYEGHWDHPLLLALNQSYKALYEGTCGSIEFQVAGAQAIIRKRTASPSKFSSHLSGFETMKAWNNQVSESLVQIQQLKWHSQPFGLNVSQL